MKNEAKATSSDIEKGGKAGEVGITALKTAEETQAQANKDKAKAATAASPKVLKR